MFKFILVQFTYSCSSNDFLQVKEHISTVAPSVSDEDVQVSLNKRLAMLINSAEAMLFMKVCLPGVCLNFCQVTMPWR